MSLAFDNPTVTTYELLKNIIDLIIIGIIIFQLAKKVVEWQRNNRSPMVLKQAKVLKKSKIRKNSKALRYTYLVVFELEEGKCMELNGHL